MTTTEQRLPAEREAEIRDWNATCRAQHIFIYTDQCVSDVLAELDAVRRERDELAERVAEAYERLDRYKQSTNL